MTELTDRQQDIYQFIADSVRQKGYPPTVREICKAVGLRSPSTVHSHLASLENKGYIKRDRAKGRAIEILAEEETTAHELPREDVVSLPLVGRVTAGEPILAVENVEEEIPLPRQIVRGAADDGFLLRVSGQSMINAGIFDGDYVIVRRQQTARDGDIVVALVDEEDATVKRFYKEKDHVRLQPENEHMDPITTRNVQVLGVVVGILRAL